MFEVLVKVSCSPLFNYKCSTHDFSDTNFRNLVFWLPGFAPEADGSVPTSCFFVELWVKVVLFARHFLCAVLEYNWSGALRRISVIITVIG